jgi:diguanylate cyclase (GGDEF)-like protein
VRRAYALIAEFDRQQAALYRRLVEDLGFEAVVVRDGSAAGAVLQARGAPPLLVADASLPGSDGFTLITELRQLVAKDTAVVVFSAFPDLRQAAANLLLGLDVAEVHDKHLPPSVMREILERSLAARLRVHQAPAAEPKTPEQLSSELLQGMARVYQVPIALLSVGAREHRWFAAHVGLSESVAALHDHREWRSALQQVMSSRQPLVVPDTAVLGGALATVPAFRVRGVVALPFLTSRERALGVLALLDMKPLTLTAEQIDGLINLARPTADEFERRYLADATGESPVRTEERWAELERLALTDALTQLYNRHAGEQVMSREAARNRRSGAGLSLALLDLDNFKDVNDAHGHEAGDRVLAEVGRILKTSFRASDLAIRWGGDEFLVLLPDVGLDGARAVSERIRMQVEALSFSGLGRVTLSAGVVEVERTEEPFAALKRADANLYAAKAAGRNNVTSSAGNGDLPSEAAQ